MKDIGSLIRRVIKDKGMTVSAFARLLNTHRRNAYNIFNRPSVDTELLKKISIILEYNFFDHYIHKNLKSTVEEDYALYKLNEHIVDVETKVFILQNLIKRSLEEVEVLEKKKEELYKNLENPGEQE